MKLHRAYPDAQWAIPNEEIAQLELALKHVEPDDIVARNAWLFATRTELPEPGGANCSWEDTQEAISRLRREVIADIFAKGGMSEVLRLVNAVQNQLSVGFELARDCARSQLH